MKSALTVAGLDPCGGAGIAADLRVFHTLGVHGMAVASSLTAQNTQCVEGVYAVDGLIFERQMSVLLDDIIPDAMKTGVLCNAQIVSIVVDMIKRYKLKNCVVDPVAVSSSGRQMLDMEAVCVMKKDLLALTRVFTPNIAEAALISGRQVETDADIMDAAKAIVDMGVEVVVITGGHLRRLATDTYYDGRDFLTMVAPLLPGSYHGTGCTFSATVAAALALGHSCHKSVQIAKNTVDAAIKGAYLPGRGMGVLRV